MKKFINILLVATIFTITIIGSLYIFSELQMNRLITEAVDNIDWPYYKGIASTCFKKDKSEYKCCLSSVEAMREIDAAISPKNGCAVDMVTDQLRCIGSLVWCVQEKENFGLDKQYEALRKRCQEKEMNVQEDCFDALDIMVKNGYRPAPCDIADYPDGFVVNGLDCVGCEDMNWCESKDGH